MSRYTLNWSFGLRNSAGQYLTAEAFGFRINCSASLMKLKQIFFLEQDPAGHVYIYSHLKRYLTVNGDGKFTCDCDEDHKGEEQAFNIEAQADGRWLLKSAKYGWYAGGTGENLSAFTTEATEEKHWVVHLAMHPQVCLRNVNRKRYVHLSDNGEQLTTDENIPWGHDATLFIEFDDKGMYRLVASNGRYLSSTGALKAVPSDDCGFILEFDGGSVSFKSGTNNKYLTSLGSTGLCKATKAAITKDEQFMMEDSWAQATFKAKKTGMAISIKQGVELAATQNMDDVSDNEIFQVEPNSDGMWIIKDCRQKLWTIVDGKVHASVDGSSMTADGAPAECLFNINFVGNHITMQDQSGNFVKRQMNKYLKCNGTSAEDEDAQFCFEIINRPKLVLRGKHGFVGSLPSGLLECNKSVPEVFDMTVTDGYCSIQIAKAGPNQGKWWMVGPNGISGSGATAEQYTIALHKESKMSICYDGKLFHGAQNGALTASGSDANPATLWEY